ncbi:DUF3857 domain-containing protein [Rapidithrix thailandica]|uniref:DUF3857 domain-containing protein n=1 Tax=Rapidithrix thailandica TaxID=413964 RepID=A0AAW9RXS9_9BACT
MKKYWMYHSIQNKLGPNIFIWVLAFAGLLSLQGFAQNYPVNTIPKDLLQGADVVARESVLEIEFISEKEYLTKEKQVYTILNRAGEEFAEHISFYDNDINISYIKGSVYDASGREANKLKKSEIQDFSAADGISLHTDARVKVAKLTHHTYPFTVAYEEENKYNTLFHLPTWMPQSAEKMAVEYALLKVHIPNNLKIRSKELNLPKPGKINKTEGSTTYTWEVKQLSAIKEEPFSPRWDEQTPSVIFAPSQFEMGGYSGNMDSWEGFGKWIAQLNRNRDRLPDATLQEIKELTQGVNSSREKIAKVYEYLQNKTRYVSIQLGIGGYQPFEASFVDEKGYGDCKALSNYAYALLKAIGIDSHYTLVYAGKSGGYPLYRDFPDNRFNHAILCVPNQGDTVWLECTSQTQAAGYMGTFTGDREVLLITPEGGKIVSTPQYGKKENRQVRVGHVNLDAQGNANANVTSRYYGAIQDGSRAHYVNQSAKEQKKWLYETMEVSNFAIQDFELQRQKEEIPFVTERLTIQVNKYASQSGKRLFFAPNLMSKNSFVPQRTEERKNEIVKRNAYIEADTITYQLPENYHIEHRPETTSFQSPFGSYESSVLQKDGKLIYIRKVEINKGRFPKEEYDALVNFYKAMYKADKQKIVLVNKT